MSQVGKNLRMQRVGQGPPCQDVAYPPLPPTGCSPAWASLVDGGLWVCPGPVTGDRWAGPQALPRWPVVGSWAPGSLTRGLPRRGESQLEREGFPFLTEGRAAEEISAAVF